MIDEYLEIRFAYVDADGDSLEDQHSRAFEQHPTLDSTGRFVQSQIGDLKISNTDVPAITGMDELENYQYEGDSGQLDLLYAPLVNYWLDDWSSLRHTDSGADARESAIRTLVEIIRVGYFSTEERPLAIFVETPAHAFRIDQAGVPPFTARSLARDTYHHLSWITVFTPAMVDVYGRETLLTAPAWETTEFEDGAVLIVCHDDVSNREKDCRSVADHIGLQSFEDI